MIFMTCFKTDPTAVYTRVCHTAYDGKHLLFVRINVANVKGICDLTFVELNSAIISDSCDYIGTQIRTLIEFSFTTHFE